MYLPVTTGYLLKFDSVDRKLGAISVIYCGGYTFRIELLYDERLAHASLWKMAIKGLMGFVQNI